MSDRSFLLYLTDIQESGQAIQSYVEQHEFDTFRVDRMRYAAVIREFEVIGEGTVFRCAMARHQRFSKCLD